MKVVASGRIVESTDLELIDLLVQYRKKGNQWEVIDKIVELFTIRYPSEVSEISKAVKEYRNNLTDKRFGETADKNMERRFIMSFPQRLYLLLKVVFRDKIVMDRTFFKKFAQRYRFTRVADNPL